MTRPRKTIKVEGEEFYHIYPIEGVSIYGVPTVERDVSEREWLRLNEYQPPAFVCDPLERGEDTTLKEGKD